MYEKDVIACEPAQKSTARRWFSFVIHIILRRKTDSAQAPTSSNNPIQCHDSAMLPV
jgi:hypothetical protein